MKKIKNILILSGGDSTRFWPLSEKSFFNFLGKPLILYQLEELSKYGEKLTVIASKKNAVFMNQLIKNSQLDEITQVIIQKENLEGQAGAVISAKNLIKGDVLVVNANDILDYSSILTKITGLLPFKNTLIIVSKKINEYFPGGYLKFSDKDEIIEILEKPGRENMPSNFSKLVVDYVSDFDILVKALENVKTTNDDQYEQGLNELLRSDIIRQHITYEGYWHTLKYPWHVLTMLHTLLLNLKEQHISKTAKISKNAEVTGPVFIGEDVRIGDFVKIAGPVYIGDNTIIGDYSLIRDSQIGEDCLIGSFNEVARSYIANKVFLHRNYVGDSVLDQDVMFGAQAVTANLRFDGVHVASDVNKERIDTGLMKFGTIVGAKSKIGVNSTITPGVKIGKNCQIAPGEKVSKDLADVTYQVGGITRPNTKI